MHSLTVSVWLTFVISFLAVSFPPALSLSEECNFASFYPRYYTAYKASSPPKMDGKVLGDPFWDEVPWTDDFEDISTSVVPRFKTRSKVRWTDGWVYVAGWMEEPQIWSNVTEHDQVIFQDNDFEVFFDPIGSSHYYKEFEMNARGVDWDLCLDKAYLNGGYENSSRVFGPKGFDMARPPNPLHCAALVEPAAALNNPGVAGSYWTTEVAFPISKVLYNQTTQWNPRMAPLEPSDGAAWRWDLSRVEWHVKVSRSVEGKPIYIKDPAYAKTDPDNWVLQRIGVIDIHLPERWAFLKFSDSAPSPRPLPYWDTQWPVRFMASTLYDAQLAYSKAKGTPATHAAQLLPFIPDGVPQSTLNGTCGRAIVHDLTNSAGELTWGGVVVTYNTSAPHWVASIRSDRLLLVQQE